MSSLIMSYIKLNNGNSMPMIGLGTWRTPPEVTKETVKKALKMGYRHIDCAHIYGNEAEVGEAIEEMITERVVTREELFITSKLWNTYHHPDMVRGACLTTLKNLRLTYLDNYLIHWPTGYKNGDDLYPKDVEGQIIFSDVDYIDTWPAMEELVDAGLCLSIGLSNFNRHQIDRILKIARICPSNLQIECHPYLSQCTLVKYCKENKIAVTAYSPLGSGHSPYPKPGNLPILMHPKVQMIAKALDRTPAQVILRWQLQREISVIPRSVTNAHMLANLNVGDFELTTQFMEMISSLNINGRFMTWNIATGHPHHPFENHDDIIFDDCAGSSTGTERTLNDDFACKHGPDCIKAGNCCCKDADDDSSATKSEKVKNHNDTFQLIVKVELMDDNMDNDTSEEAKNLVENPHVCNHEDCKGGHCKCCNACKEHNEINLDNEDVLQPHVCNHEDCKGGDCKCCDACKEHIKINLAKEDISACNHAKDCKSLDCKCCTKSEPAEDNECNSVCKEQIPNFIFCKICGAQCEYGDKDCKDHIVMCAQERCKCGNVCVCDGKQANGEKD